MLQVAKLQIAKEARLLLDVMKIYPDLDLPRQFFHLDKRRLKAWIEQVEAKSEEEAKAAGTLEGREQRDQQPAAPAAPVAAVAPAAPTEAARPDPARADAARPDAARPDPARSGPARRTPPRLRVFFLRHFRACGEVKLAAEQTGIALSTLYRWRKRDAAFREHWDGLAEQRRQMAEDRLMRFVREGEKTAVFHKGEQVGWRQSHTPRAALAALAYFDRREARERNETRRLASHSSAAEGIENPGESTISAARDPRKIGTIGNRPLADQGPALPGAGQHQEGRHADGAHHEHAEEGTLAKVGMEQAGELEDRRLQERQCVEIDGEGHAEPAHQADRRPGMGGEERLDLDQLHQSPVCHIDAVGGRPLHHPEAAAPALSVTEGRGLPSQ